VAEVIGAARCPACRSDRASLRVSGKGLAYLLCNACNLQVFARSDQSDEALRSWLVQVQAAPPASVSPIAPVPAAVQALPAPREEPRMTWGVLGAAA
jgi:hypothetical protein